MDAREDDLCSTPLFRAFITFITVPVELTLCVIKAENKYLGHGNRWLLHSWKFVSIIPDDGFVSYGDILH